MSKKWGDQGFIQEELRRRREQADTFAFTWARQAGKSRFFEEVAREQHEHNLRHSARARLYPDHTIYLAPRDRPRDALNMNRRPDGIWSLS